MRKAFARYRSALMAKDGAAAAEAVDTGTLAYYGRIHDLALTGTAASVKKQGLIDRMMVVRIRHDVDVETLKKMNGPALFAYAVDNGWVSASSVEKAELGKVKVTGKDAKGEFVSGGRVAPFSFEFKKEAKGWRFSLLPLLSIGEPALKQMAQQSGQEENDFLLALIEKVSGKAVPHTIWEPQVPTAGNPKARKK